MKFELDIKSTGIGLVLGLGIALCIGATSASPTPNKRFQMNMNESHAYILDTETGQVWGRFLPKDSGMNDLKFSNSKTGHNE